MKRFYVVNDQPVTAAQFGEFIADLMSQGYTLQQPQMEAR